MHPGPSPEERSHEERKPVARRLSTFAVEGGHVKMFFLKTPTAGSKRGAGGASLHQMQKPVYRGKVLHLCAACVSLRPLLRSFSSRLLLLASPGIRPIGILFSSGASLPRDFRETAKNNFQVSHASLDPWRSQLQC